MGRRGCAWRQRTSIRDSKAIEYVLNTLPHANDVGGRSAFGSIGDPFQRGLFHVAFSCLVRLLFGPLQGFGMDPVDRGFQLRKACLVDTYLSKANASVPAGQPAAAVVLASQRDRRFT